MYVRLSRLSLSLNGSRQANNGAAVPLHAGESHPARPSARARRRASRRYSRKRHEIIQLLQRVVTARLRRPRRDALHIHVSDKKFAVLKQILYSLL